MTLFTVTGDSEGKEVTKEVPIAAGTDSHSVQRIVREAFNVKDDHLLLKVSMLGCGICL